MAEKKRPVSAKGKSAPANSSSLRVLIVEDSEDDALLIIRELKKVGFKPFFERVETADGMSAALREKNWDIILCDYRLPQFDAVSAITLAKAVNEEIPVIIVSGAIGEEAVTACIRHGACGYVLKNNLSRLGLVITRELAQADLRIRQKQEEARKTAAHEALRASEERYRTILENMQEAYFELDNRGDRYLRQ